MSFDLNNKTNKSFDQGVGDCFGVWQFVYHSSLNQGASTELALELASTAFNNCVEEAQR
jgi:hypothetical protein